MDLLLHLTKSLKGARRVAVLGVGSEFKGDDAAGGLVAAKLVAARKSKRAVPSHVFFGETAPENLTGAIKAYKPTHLVIVDCADTGAKPGTIDLIPVENAGGISFATHMLPMKIMVDYMLESMPGLRVVIIGIQPKVLAYGKPPSAVVKRSVDQVAKALLSSLNK